jgi:tetratricopeptide (TPR) repeat protein
MNRKFHPWEGGEGKVSGQYVMSLIEQAKLLIENNDNEKAIELLDDAQTYPHNLGEGKLYGAMENDIFYWTGLAYERAGDKKAAERFYVAATQGNITLGNAMYYNDQQPDKIFYQGLAWHKLGDHQRSVELFKQLVSHGSNHLEDQVSIDYFAVSLPNLLIFEDDLSLRNRLNCLYLQGLGYLGLQSYNEAKSCFNEVLKYDCSHLGANTHTILLNHRDLL